VESQIDAQRPADANYREVTAMPVSREQMLEELHKAEQARDLLADLERRLAGEIQNWRAC
jgi:hypothetical protein